MWTLCGLSTTHMRTTNKPPTRGEASSVCRVELRGDVRLDSPLVCRGEAGIAEPTGVLVSMRGDSLANGEHLAEQHSVEGFVQVPVSTETQGR